MQLKKAICSFIYFKILGWEADVNVPDYDKYIICAAPHTSNWDFIIGKLFYAAIGRKTGFMMKKEWFFFPLGYLFKAMGGIPVNRSKNTSTVNSVSNTAMKSKTFHLCITPEGTRSANPNWKKGFYYIAYKAHIPILLFGIDYKNKRIIGNKEIIPSGDYEKDIKEIKRYFIQFTGKYPEKFEIGEL